MTRRCIGWAGAMVGIVACVGPAPEPPQVTESGSGGATADAGSTGVSAAATGGGPGSSGEAPLTTSATSPADGDASTNGTTAGGTPNCAQDNGGCDPNATCSDDAGDVECTCNPGYEGDGQQCSVDATLPTIRVETSCLPVGDQPGCGGSYCLASAVDSDEAMMAGDLAVTYEVTLRFRGVVEEKSYLGGTDDGLWNEGGIPDDDGWNTYSLDISNPAQSYWLNSGSQGVSHCEGVDYQQTVSVMGGSMVGVAMSNPNNCATRNLDDAGAPIVVPGIPPAPEAFDGQFLQVDVVEIVPVP